MLKLSERVKFRNLSMCPSHSDFQNAFGDSGMSQIIVRLVGSSGSLADCNIEPLNLHTFCVSCRGNF